MKHRNRYSKAAERMTMVEAFELEIERAWVLLIDMRRPVTLQITDEAKITWIRPGDPKYAGVEIGTFTRGISLAELREEAFFVFDEMARNRFFD